MVFTNEHFMNSTRKTIYENTIAYAQLRRILSTGTNVKFNSSMFSKICYNKSFNTNFFSSRAIVFLALYQDQYELPIVKLLNKEECFIPEDALNLLNNYNRYCYYRNLNNDFIPLPDKVYEEFTKTFMPDTSINEDYSYEGDCEDTIKLIKYMKSSTKYMIYEMLNTKSISEYHYDKSRMKFEYQKKYAIVEE
jgi:hypothetical protein